MLLAPPALSPAADAAPLLASFASGFAPSFDIGASCVGATAARFFPIRAAREDAFLSAVLAFFCLGSASAAAIAAVRSANEM